MSQRLKNRVTLITGAGSGIGRASALRFAAEGAIVVVNDINAANAAATVRTVTEQGGQAVAHYADVTDATQVKDMIAQVVSQFGRLDILFNNAGGAMPKPTHETSIDEYRKIVALNLDAVFYGIHAALPVMLRQKSGTILSTSSGAGINAVKDLAAYGAAKAGVISLSKNIATEYGPHGIRSNVISPGPMDTPALRAWLDKTPGGAEKYARGIPSGRLGTADDIAHAAVFLATDEAIFINGAVIPVDGAIHSQLASPNIE